MLTDLYLLSLAWRQIVVAAWPGDRFGSEHSVAQRGRLPRR